MAKIELLHVLGILLLVLCLISDLNTSFAESCQFEKTNMDLAKTIAVRSRQMGMDAIKKKWLELKNMENSKSDNGIEFTTQEFGQNALRVFVSHSMGKSLLKSYIAGARRYGAILVFKGLPNGSWRELSDLIYEITEGERAAIELDDIAFSKYGIVSVPSFIFSKEEDVFDLDRDDSNISDSSYDKIVGNIGIRRALEEIAASGDLSDDANRILGRLQ